MIKFSIIVPVYNVEKYLKKCLNSIKKQTFKDYEVIIVNDESTDDSEKIVNEFVKANNNFKKISASKTGLSEARNIGISKAKGEYFLLLDGDDYYDNKLLETINLNLNDNPDLVRFQIREIFPDRKVSYEEKPFQSITGIESFENIINYHFVENAWAYCYKTSFYKKNNFEFMKNCIAEDFGLLPLVIAKADKVKALDFIGYNYVQRENSLMRNNDYNKRLKKMEDMIKQSIFLNNQLKKITGTEKFIVYINNSLIYYIIFLKYEDYKKYYKFLKSKKFFDSLISDTLKIKIKKMMLKKFPYFFYNVYRIIVK